VKAKHLDKLAERIAQQRTIVLKPVTELTANNKEA
jgi:23S rRNA (adenine2503-C2)-methyltransferase